MNKNKTIAVNDETGEVIFEYDLNEKPNDGKNKSETRLCKNMIGEMCQSAKSVKDLDSNLLKKFLYITGELNNYGQVKIIGSYINEAINDKILEDITITGYTMRVLKKAHNFNGVIMKNRQTPIKNWGELWAIIGCTGRSNQIKMKKFLTDNEMVRIINYTNKKWANVNKFILNPFLLRGSSFSSQVAIMLFQDFIEEGVNMNIHSVRWLQSLELVD